MTRRRIVFCAMCILLMGLVTACSGSPEPERAAPRPAPSTQAPKDTTVGSAVAERIEQAVRGFVEERSDGDVYDIPARGGHDVSGQLAAFHAVKRQDADTYVVCVDFMDGDNVYDVDFLVDRSRDGLTVTEHYLHKVNGEAVQ